MSHKAFDTPYGSSVISSELLVTPTSKSNHPYSLSTRDDEDSYKVPPSFVAATGAKTLPGTGQLCGPCQNGRCPVHSTNPVAGVQYTASTDMSESIEPESVEPESIGSIVTDFLNKVTDHISTKVAVTSAVMLKQLTENQLDQKLDALEKRFNVALADHLKELALFQVEVKNQLIMDLISTLNHDDNETD